MENHMDGKCQTDEGELHNQIRHLISVSLSLWAVSFDAIFD